MGDRKFMIENSKCFTDMIVHSLLQLLKPLPKWENSPGSPAAWLHTQPGVGREHIHFRGLLFCCPIRSTGSSLAPGGNHLNDVESCIYK